MVAVDISPGMLAQATAKAARQGTPVVFVQADAQRLPFPDDTFDAVVSTFSLCGVPDERVAVAEMARVLRPGGSLLLADHVASTSWWLRAGQRLLELVTIPLHNEHFTRRPRPVVEELGLRIIDGNRSRFGVIERLRAVKDRANVA